MNKRTQKKIKEWIDTYQIAREQILAVSEGKMENDKVSALTRVLNELGRDFIEEIVQNIIAESLEMPEGYEDWYIAPRISFEYIDLQLRDDKGKIKSVDKWYAEFDWLRFGIVMWTRKQTLLEKEEILEKENRKLKIKLKG